VKQLESQTTGILHIPFFSARLAMQVRQLLASGPIHVAQLASQLYAYNSAV
jgi:hypothetical protein